MGTGWAQGAGGTNTGVPGPASGVVVGTTRRGGAIVPVQGTEAGAAPVGGEPRQDSDEDLGGARPAGNSKGGWAHGSAGHDEKSRTEAEAGVVVVEKGKTDSSNTTWREMRARQEVRS